LSPIRQHLVIAALAAAALVGCGRKAEEPATAASETGAPITPKENGARLAFTAKVDEVETYMKQHDASNTPADELAAALSSFQKDFETLAAASTEKALAERCRLAAESMALYGESLTYSADDAAAMNLALDAQEKWRRARDAGNGAS